MSAWQTQNNKKMVSTAAANLSNHKRTKIVTEKEFWLAKPKYMEVSQQLSDLFDNINKMVSTSSQRAASAQINHNQHNHNKWHIKKSDDVDEKTKILSCFNMLAITNYNEIFTTLRTLSIDTYDEMVEIVNDIYGRMIFNDNCIELCTKIIFATLINCSWIVYDQQFKPISFRKLFLEKLEFEFNTIIDHIRSNGEIVDQRIKNKRKALFMIICSFFKESIIGDQLFRFIFTSLESAFLETKYNELMDYWIIMMNVAIHEWTDHNLIYIDEKRNFLFENNKLFTQKTILLTESMGQIKNKQFGTDNNDLSELDNPNIYKGYDTELLILSTSEYGSISEWYQSIVELDNEAPGLIIKIIEQLSKKTTDLKNTFTILLYIGTHFTDFTNIIKINVSAFSDITTCEAYSNNAKKLLIALKK